MTDVEAQLEELGEAIIAPALPETQVQQLVLRLFGGGRSVALINGVAAHLLQKVTEPQVFVQLGLLLEAEPVMGLLESWAFSNQALLLQFRIIGARAYADANKRAVAFARCLKAAKEHGEPLTASLTEHAFSCCWLDGTPTAEEALKIVAAVARDLLAQTYANI